MLAGLPVEMITMLGSSLLGGFMSIWGQSIKAKQDEQKLLLARADNQMKHIESARKYDNKGFQWTRRIIALTAVFFIIAYPKLVPVFFDTSVFLTWTEFSRGFLFLVEKKWTPVDTTEPVYTEPVNKNVQWKGIKIGGVYGKKPTNFDFKSWWRQNKQTGG